MTIIQQTTLLFVALSAVVSAPAMAGTKVHVGQATPAAQRVSINAIDHQLWNSLLTKYVDEAGRVNYQAWKGSPRDLARLDGYLNELSRADTRAPANRDASLAFWINAYNAVTIKGILREYPTASIRNHTARLYGYNIWHDLLLVVGDSRISLHAIEHDILRKSGEPRIHFAIVCASVGCPRLRNKAYNAANVQQQLAEDTREFFASSANFQQRGASFAVSSILKWFPADFGATERERLRFLAPYLPTESARQAALRGDVSLRYLSYDWSLNDQATARTARR